jgi:hypothetical protein
MAGSWANVSPDGRWEEHWMAPLGGTMVGMSRLVAGGATIFTEAIRIETRQDGIFYVAHPSGQGEDSFRLTRLEAGLVAFTNPAHRSPHTIAYRLESDGSLLAWVENEDGTREEFPMRRSTLVP